MTLYYQPCEALAYEICIPTSRAYNSTSLLLSMPMNPTYIHRISPSSLQKYHHTLQAWVSFQGTIKFKLYEAIRGSYQILVLEAGCLIGKGDF
jgi:hypothetical protein